MQNLKQKTISAFVWSFIDKFGQQALTFIVGIVLARFFLTPADYGLMGMLAIFIALSSLLLDSGFGIALIRKQDLNQTDICSVFYFNIFISILLYTILFFSAPFIAAFYHQPILKPLCRVATVLILINASSNIQYNLFLKNLKIKYITISNLIGLTFSSGIILFLAAKGYGVWALVWQNIIFVGTRNVCIWLFSTWRPSLIFDFNCIKSFWSFSSRVLMTGGLNTIFNNIFSLLIGKFYPLREVGYYTQANKFSELSGGTILATIQTASYPIMSQIHNDAERLKRVYRKIVRVTSFLSFPILFGIAAVAFPLVHVLLTNKWIFIVPYMQKLCIGGAFLPLAAININILYVRGFSAKVFKFEITRKIIILLCIVLTLKLSVSALITGLVIANIAGFLLSAYISGNLTKYSILEQIKDIFPYFFIAFIMASGIFLLSFYITNSLRLLITQIITGCILYFGIVYILGSKIFREMLELVRGNRN